MWEQSVHEIPLSAVIRIRQVRMTNKTRAEAPELRYSEDDLPCSLGNATKREKNQYMADKERMVLRWMFIMRFRNALERKGYLSTPTVFETFILRPLQESECTKGLGKSAEVQRSQWRSDVTQQSDTDLVEVNADGSKQYTFFDSCKCSIMFLGDPLIISSLWCRWSITRSSKSWSEVITCF